MSDSVKISNEELETMPAAKEILTALNKLVELCKSQPDTAMFCSICLPDEEIINDPDGQDVRIVNIYAGNSISQIQQFNTLADSNPQFLADLTMFLEMRIKKQMEKVGTTGNKDIDSFLANFNSSERPN